MRFAGLSALMASFSLHALSAIAAECYSDHTATGKSIADVFKPQAVFNGPVANFCNAMVGMNGEPVIIQEIGGITFYIIRGTTQSIKECKASFADIIIQCVSDPKSNGGKVIGANGAIYKAGIGESVWNELGPRRVNGGRTRKTRPKSTGPKKSKQRKPGPKNTRLKKTHTSKTHTKKVSTKKPSNTSKGKASTTSSAKTKPTKSCKQMYALAAKAAKTEASKNRKSTKALVRRDGMSDITIFEKRTSKLGSTRCAFGKMNALDYPEVGTMPSNAKYYNFDHPLICNNFLFGSSSSPHKHLKQEDYQIEHVLEWQVVTKFFDWLSNKLRDKKFPNPNPTQVLPNGERKMIKFCTYLDATWHGSFTPTFKLAFSKDVVERTALGHIKWAYPGTGHYDDEFVYLQTTINAPAKKEMWGSKKTRNIYGDTSHCDKIKKTAHWGMSDLIRGHKALAGGICPAAAANIDDSREAYLKLKWIYGARQYLKHPDIREIFKKQKERIGGVLDALDTEMENQRKTNKKGEIQDPWKKQGLKDLWDEYMEEKFEIAKTRSKNDMQKYIRLLENVWLPKNNKGTDSSSSKGSKKVARAGGSKLTGGKTTGDKSNAKGNDEVSLERDQTLFFAQVQELKTLWAKEEKATWDAPWL